MKKNFIYALAILPILAACSDGEVTAPTATETVTVEAGAGASTSPEVVTETVTVTVEPAVEEPTTEVPEAEEPAASEQPASEEDPDAYGEPVLSDRGFLVKDVGQLAGVQLEDGTPLVNFTLVEVETDFTCTSDWDDPAENGQFVAFTFEVETFPALAEDDETFYGSFGLNDFYLTAFSDDGVRANDISGNAWSCLDSADSLPADIGPGQKAAGKVVIDTDLESGSLVYEPMSWDVSMGWEWKF